MRWDEVPTADPLQWGGVSRHGVDRIWVYINPLPFPVLEVPYQLGNPRIPSPQSSRVMRRSFENPPEVSALLGR